MAFLSLAEEGKKQISSQSSSLRDALVICDEVSAAILASSSPSLQSWITTYGVKNIISLYAPLTTVYDVSTMAPLFTDITQNRRAVFYISRPLHEQLSIICDMIRYYSFTIVTINSLCISEPLTAALAPISTAPIIPTPHDGDDDDNDDDDGKVKPNDVTQFDLTEAAAMEAAFEGLKARTSSHSDSKDNKISGGSGHEDIASLLADSINISVRHLPLPYVTTCIANTFLLPSCHTAFPLLAPATSTDDAPVPHLDKDDARYLLRQRLMANNSSTITSAQSLLSSSSVAAPYTDITPFIPVASSHRTPLSSSSSAYSRATSMTVLSSSLCSLCQSLSIRPSIFSIGSSAKTVAQQFMTAWADHEKLHPPAPADATSPTSSSPAAGSSSNTCSFVIVDRTLDLVAPTLHSECLLDRMYRVLPSYTPWNGTIDIAIPSTLTPRTPTPNSSSAAPSSSSSTSGESSESVNVVDALTSAIHDREGTRTIQSLTMQFAAQALISLRRACAAVTTTEVKKDAGDVTVEELEGYVKKIHATPSLLMRHTSLLQITIAVIDTLRCSSSSQWATFAAAERICQQTAAHEGTHGLLLQIADVIRPTVRESKRVTSKKSSIINSDTSNEHDTSVAVTLDQALSLAIFAYSLAGSTGAGVTPFSSDDEATFITALTSLLTAANNKVSGAQLMDQHRKEKEQRRARRGSGSFISLGTTPPTSDTSDIATTTTTSSETKHDSSAPPSSTSSSAVSEESMRVLASGILARLHAIAAARTNLTMSDLAALHIPPEATMASSSSSSNGYQSLLSRLLTHIMNPSSSLDDLEHHKPGGIGEGVKKITEAVVTPSASSSGWGFSSMVSAFTAGIGRITEKAARPDDHRTLILFVIGGITCSEVKEIQEQVSQQTKLQVLIGSTEMATAHTVIHHTLLQPHPPPSSSLLPSLG